MSEATPRRIALLLEYDGGDYAGSQLQPGLRTVQGALEDAVRETGGEAARVAMAGRTDAGVHARGQVACFTTLGRLDCGVWQRALNARLPRDIAVLAAAEVEPGFDPRRVARRRQYRYRIAQRDVRLALERDRAWQVGQRLDVGAMTAAASRLVGRRDFAAFASPLETAGASTVRELFSFSVRQEDGGRLALDLEANAFLPHQVRRMTGALVAVGRGLLTPDDYAGLLDAPPASVTPVAPPWGLYLMRVDYARPLFDVPPTPDRALD